MRTVDIKDSQTVLQYLSDGYVNKRFVKAKLLA